MSIWHRFKTRLRKAISAGQGVGNDDDSASGRSFQAVDQKAQIVRLATDVLEGRLGLTEGSGQLLMYLGAFPEAFPYFTVLFDERQLREVVPIFGAVQNAADRFHPLPGSRDRHLWDADVVAKRDQDRETFEATVRAHVTEACRNIIVWLSANQA
jgi:hypothetical protein